MLLSQEASRHPCHPQPLRQGYREGREDSVFSEQTLGQREMDRCRACPGLPVFFSLYVLCGLYVLL